MKTDTVLMSDYHINL